MTIGEDHKQILPTEWEWLSMIKTGGRREYVDQLPRYPGQPSELSISAFAILCGLHSLLVIRPGAQMRRSAGGRNRRPRWSCLGEATTKLWGVGLLIPIRCRERILKLPRLTTKGGRVAKPRNASSWRCCIRHFERPWSE